ncbi:hypothetical protein JYU29_12280 [Tianweitania sp. BSSL-BM11]|uniref:Uncharacterized protein n=1 Tax=Tianweitania aestuarii TaxID=2814886 RepID=A0ABS5RWT8_9HYPH|nr:hypothetical protein [Tianweitania aestuarii]MBS9721462.1 hypothetical protein [Tianweitania aestuarii]
MSETTIFVFDLLRAANEIDQLSRSQRIRFILRAAALIQDQHQHTLDLKLIANNNSSDLLDVVEELRGMARLIECFTPSEISLKIAEAAGIIHAGMPIFKSRTVLH